MLGGRYILLGLLACLALSSHLTSAFTQDTPYWLRLDGLRPNPEIDYDDYINEDEMDENDIDKLAEEIAEGVDNVDEEEDEGPFARGKLGKKGGLKIFGGGLKKGDKKVGGAVLTAGKKKVKVSGGSLKVTGKGPKKVSKTNGKELLKGGPKVGKGGKTGSKAGNGLKNTGTGKNAKRPIKGSKKGTKSWDKMKEKNGGDKNKAGNKLLKAVAKEILEQGASLAVEAITPLIIEYILEKTQEGLCSCEDTTCGCCAQPPGFEKACLIMRIRPNKKIVNGAITYNGEELANINITKIEGEAACTKLSGVASFIQTCISPIGIGEFDEGFRGCLDINLEPLSLERTMCVDFKGTRKNGTANWVPTDELDAIEIEAEAAEEEEEEG